jgi:lysozyme
VGDLSHLRDVSNNNGPVRWREERARGVVAAYCKVSQGLTFTDGTAKRRLRAARAAGVRAGGYHYATPGVGAPELQAERLYRLAPRAAGCLRPCLDCEANPLRLNDGQLAAWYLGAVLHLKARLGVWPVIYGSPSYLQAFALYHPAVFGACPLWVANYGVERPHVPAPWSHWAAWQWTETFRDPAAGVVDDSYVADLAALTVPRSLKALRP